MNKWPSIAGAVCFVAFFYFLSSNGGSDQQRQKEETARIVSCNHLKGIAIAAKASEPTCAR